MERELTQSNQRLGEVAGCGGSERRVPFWDWSTIRLFQFGIQRRNGLSGGKKVVGLCSRY